VSAGTTAVTLDFNGNVIARAVNGPYQVRSFAGSAPNGALTRVSSPKFHAAETAPERVTV